MYFETIQQFSKILRSLHSILAKAQAHADARKFDSGNYLSARLAPDMFALARQIQSACDGAKFAAARLTGIDAPRHEDNEKNLDELSARIEKTIAFLDTFKPEHFAGSATRKATFPWMEGKYLQGAEYLVQMATPNFYFHVSMAYALLRHSGVEIGKMDFLGQLPFKDL